MTPFPGWVRWLHAVTLTALWAWFTLGVQTTSWAQVGLTVGGGIVVVLSLVVLQPGVWTRWSSLPAALVSSSWQRQILVCAPWGLGLALLWHGGLWWSQRPSSLRLFAVALLMTWSIAWSRPATPPPPERARSLAIGVALMLWALGAQGLGFGLTSFGIGLSGLAATGGAVALAVARLGRQTHRLNLLAAVGATVVTIGAVETGVRLMGLGAEAAAIDDRAYARSFYSLTPPGHAFVSRPRALDEFDPVLIEINRAGTRGPQPGPEADLLLIGDSFIEARQLPWEATVGPRLYDRLAALGTPTRVVSHGMRGWSPLLEWNWYLKVGRTFKPRVVLLFFFWNDLWPAGEERSTFRAVLTPDGRPDYFDVIVEPPWIWYHRLRILRLVDQASRELGIEALRRAALAFREGADSRSRLDDTEAFALATQVAEAPPLTPDQIQAALTRPHEQLDQELRTTVSTGFWPGLRPQSLWTGEQQAAARTIEAELKGLAEDVRRDGATPVIVYVPNPVQVAPTECSVGRLFDRIGPGIVLPKDSGVQAWLREVGQRHGIDVLDPSDAMRQARAAGSAGPFYLRADCHWSAAGHDFVAAWLAAWYQRHGTGGPTPGR